MKRVFLVRHASHDRLGKVLCGRMPDVSLSAQGRAEAEAMATALARRLAPDLHTSPTEQDRAPLLALAGRREEIELAQHEARRYPLPAADSQGGGERTRLAPVSDGERTPRSGIRVLSSPQTRTQETAAPLAQKLGAAIETADEIDEIEFGAWTGRAFAEFASDPAWVAWNGERATARPPGGESMGEVQARALRLLDRLGREAGPPAILVSHADTIRAALLGVLGLSLDAYDRLVVAPASWSELALWPGGGRVVSINERASP
ncbi:histidine phosphatase family protein [Methylorubrum extorquens]|uniref:histidine phosphatase family protein n=1 Tax=Methylorubrum extorquens TaxID=408 RepID=UPI002236F9BC|nr:histidine phosphatase family protein [Methylorubrum extorquens]UYW26514.1 histidine phosphatase family protein [Methylorubrum extorquens]UYW33690.1 histidine phosphatase family protein [Methylorubrum extorquens]